MPTGAQSIRSGFDQNRWYATALVKSGEDVATTTTYRPTDPALSPELNGEVCRWLTERGGEEFYRDAEELAAQPVSVQQEVQIILTQIRAAQPDAPAQ